MPESIMVSYCSNLHGLNTGTSDTLQGSVLPSCCIAWCCYKDKKCRGQLCLVVDLRCFELSGWCSSFSGNLTWRDVQHVVVETARIPNDKEGGWMVNGAGYHVNHRFGFGALDCAKMVEAAQNWKNVPQQHTCNVPAKNNPV